MKNQTRRDGVLQLNRMMLCLLAFAFGCPAQTLDTVWSKRFDGRGLDDGPNRVRVTREGNLLVAATLGNGYTVAEAALLELDSNGTLLKGRLFHKAYDDLATDAVKLADGGYLLSGYSQYVNVPCAAPWKVDSNLHAAISAECSQAGGTSYYNAFLIRLDANMDTLWTRSYAPRLLDFIHPSAGGNIVAVARNGTNNGGANDTLLLLRMNASGNLVSRAILGMPGTSALYYLSLGDSGFVLGGSKGSGNARASWVARIDTAGTVVWERNDPTRGATWSLAKDRFGRILQYGNSLPDNGGDAAGVVSRYDLGGQIDTIVPIPRVTAGVESRLHGITGGGQYLLSSADADGFRLRLYNPATGASRTSTWDLVRRFTDIMGLPSSGAWYAFGSPSTNFGTTQNDIQVVKLGVNNPPRFADRFRTLKVRMEGDGEWRDTLRATDDFPGDSARLTWTGTANSRTQFSAATGVFRWQPPSDYFGDTSFTFMASDRLGQTDTLRYSMRVTGVNDDPTLSLNFARFDRQQAAAPGDTVLGTVVGVDADRDSLTYNLAFPVPGLTLDSKTGAFRWVPQFPLGPQPVYFEVSDGHVIVRRGFSFIVTNNVVRSEPVSVTFGAFKPDTLTLSQGVQFVFSTLGATQSQSFSFSQLQEAALDGRPALYWELSGTTDSLPDFRIKVVQAMLASTDSVFYYASGLDRFLPIVADRSLYAREFTARRLTSYEVVVADTAGMTFVVPVRPVVPGSARLALRSTGPGEREIRFPGEIPEGLKLEWVELSGRKRPVAWSSGGYGLVRITLPPGGKAMGVLQVRGAGKSWALPILR